jgi:hypothetical protein
MIKTMYTGVIRLAKINDSSDDRYGEIEVQFADNPGEEDQVMLDVIEPDRISNVYIRPGESVMTVELVD